MFNMTGNKSEKNQNHPIWGWSLQQNIEANKCSPKMIYL